MSRGVVLPVAIHADHVLEARVRRPVCSRPARSRPGPGDAASASTSAPAARATRNGAVARSNRRSPARARRARASWISRTTPPMAPSSLKAGTMISSESGTCAGAGHKRGHLPGADGVAAQQVAEDRGRDARARADLAPLPPQPAADCASSATCARITYQQHFRPGVAFGAEARGAALPLQHVPGVPQVARQRDERRRQQHAAGKVLDQHEQPVALHVIGLQGRGAARPNANSDAPPRRPGTYRHFQPAQRARRPRSVSSQ